MIVLCVLQMFARELTAGWTSWGNQVLHFQQKHFFEPLRHDSNASDHRSDPDMQLQRVQ